VAAVKLTRTQVLVLTAVGGVVAGVLVFLGVLALAGSPKAKSHLGSNVFRVGDAKHQATIVDRHGPLLFQDLLGHGRDMYVQHLGGTSWVAFVVHPPGEAASCTVRWREKSRDFMDSCSGRIYPADGNGLIRYQASVDRKGDLVVDLRRPLS
jgi:hypothetical protein